MGEHQQGNNPYIGRGAKQTPRHLREYGVASPASWIPCLEYSGAALGIVGWLGVRQIGSTWAQELGFLIWIISGLILIAWGFRTHARGIMLINAVNVIMAASAFASMV